MYVLYGLAGFVLIMVFSFIRKTDRFEDFCVATFVVAFLMVLAPMLLLTGYVRPLTWDSRLHTVDLWLGLDGFALSRFVARSNWISFILAAVYDGLPFALAVSWVVDRSKLMLKAAVIGGLLVAPFYFLVPACGPKYAFKEYPWNTVVPAGLVAVPRIFPRNCFPSMHYAWALLLFLNTRGWLWKTIFFSFSVLLGISTIAGGEHYVIDVIASIPFTLMVQKIAEAWERKRRSPFGAAPERGVSPGGI